MAIFLSFAVLFMTCKDKKTTQADRIAKEWIGKTIQFPKGDSILNMGSKEFKILLYTDSTGCTRCKSRLDIWQSYIEELGNQVNFLFYFHPKDEESLLSMFRFEMFDHHVFIDDDDKLNKLNKFSNNSMFQCFLLDKNDRVLAIGNPVHNSKIWDLYKQIIVGEISDNPPKQP